MTHRVRRHRNAEVADLNLLVNHQVQITMSGGFGSTIAVKYPDF